MIGDAFCEHVEACDHCNMHRGKYCAKARSLLEHDAQRAAERLAPVPYVMPGGAKA